VQALGKDEATGLDVTLRDGRFGPYLQLGEGEKPKRVSLPKGLGPADIDLAKAIELLSLPREVAKHPETGEPILAGIGRYGPYVQHGRTFANLEANDDVLEIGANRAIDLVVARETKGPRSRFGGGGTPAGRELGAHPEGGPVVVRPGRFGPYVNHDKLNATLPRGLDPDTLTLDQALELLRKKQESGGGARPARRTTKRAAPKAEAGAKAKTTAKTAASRKTKSPAKAKKRAG
jgi:DNA topoisomerase-1